VHPEWRCYGCYPLLPGIAEVLEPPSVKKADIGLVDDSMVCIMDSRWLITCRVDRKTPLLILCEE
jgi:hypothetical protein